MDDNNQKPKSSNSAAIIGVLYSFFLMALFYFGLKWNFSSGLLVFLSILSIVILVIVVFWDTKRQTRRKLHENDQLSQLIYRVKRIEGGKSVGLEQMVELKQQLLAFAEANPKLEGEAYRYLGDLAFAMMETENSLKYYAKALDKLERDSDDYLYVFNRYAAGMLRVRYYAEAFREFESLANTKPFYSIGLAAMYEFGWGIEPDLEEASRLYKQAMLEGNDLAVMNYYEVQWRMSNPVPDPYKDGYAEYMLKCNDLEGYKAGVPALMESAKAGYAPAQFELGTLFMQRNLGRNKRAEAFHWLRLGANQNYLPALHNLGFLVQIGCMDPIKGDINKPKIPGTLLYDDKVRFSSYESGMALIQQAADAGYPPSQHSIGATFLRAGNHDSAKVWLKRAANQGYKQAKEDYEKTFGKLH